MTSGFVFVNLGATFRMFIYHFVLYTDNLTVIGLQVIIVVLLSTTARSDMHPASYVFGAAGLFNQTGGWNTGIAFLFGVLSVQWTVRLWCCMK